ncbi:MAG: hypothetical protein ABIF77_06695 [bacterium]
MNRYRIWRTTVPVFLTELLLTSLAVAGPNAHDEGFFLRMSAGGGSAGTKLEVGGEFVEFTGTCGDINFAIGGIVSPNLALHGTIYGWVVSDPDLEIRSTELSTAGPTPTNSDLTMGAVGIGMTYWFMPANLYLSTTIGSAGLTLEAAGLEYNWDRGLALDVTLGKEWWVGDAWGIGVAGGVIYHSLPETGINENWSGTSFAIRFTATHN